jgi:hypothetical protein
VVAWFDGLSQKREDALVQAGPRKGRGHLSRFRAVRRPLDRP